VRTGFSVKISNGTPVIGLGHQYIRILSRSDLGNFTSTPEQRIPGVLAHEQGHVKNGYLDKGDTTGLKAIRSELYESLSLEKL
jgi:hypothetical protein